MSSAIRTEHLTKRFRSVEALRGLNLSVSQNSIYALVGPNGAGKTTTIKILMNIIAPTSGHAEVLGLDCSLLRGAAFASIGYVSENQQLPEWMKVGELLRYMQPFYPTWDKELEAELVKELDLPLNRKLKTLSRGMRMKAALASSLAYRPKLIVLDEPFTGLDPLVRDEFIQGLLERASESTIFISSHDLAEIESFASHVGYLQDGQLLFSEELNSLSDRFREVEVALPSRAAPRNIWPDSWMQIEVFENAVRFVESNFEDDSLRGEISRRFGEVRDITLTPMSLRSIFVAIARSNGSKKESASS